MLIHLSVTIKTTQPTRFGTCLMYRLQMCGTVTLLLYNRIRKYLSAAKIGDDSMFSVLKNYKQLGKSILPIPIPLNSICSILISIPHQIYQFKFFNSNSISTNSFNLLLFTMSSYSQQSTFQVGLSRKKYFWIKNINGKLICGLKFIFRKLQFKFHFFK